MGTAGAAVTLPSGSTPLPGSTFQGGDGDQDDALPGRLDWQGFEQAGRVVHSPDGGLQFGPGDKEDKPGEWTLIPEGTGVSPPKDNIFDAWSSVDQPAADTFLYLAFAREKGNGTTTIAFDLSQDAGMWNNDGDPATPEVPCRRTGDVLVVFDAHGNDGGMDVHLERWVTETSDSSTSCARTGQLDALLTTSIPAGSAQGASNPAPIMSFLPGHFPAGTEIPEQRLFGEAALNLTKLLDAALGSRCFSFASIWMHSRASEPETSAMKDYLGPQPLVLNSCAAAGTKFADLNANGQRDTGEPGLPGFVIWADYDNDGVRDGSEPFTVTDRQGHYVLKNIRPPTGSYTLRETLLVRRRVRGATAWKCSFPNAGTQGGFANGPGGLFGCGWGPIPATVPYAQGKDFGNWLPAQLTVAKELWPADDPGRFDLKVNGVTVVPAAGDGASKTIQVPAGSYNITEQAVAGTDPAAYTSRVRCQRTTRRRGTGRSGTEYLGLVLRPGRHAKCTFFNVRKGTPPDPTPAIAVEKAGPTAAIAGATLRYTFYVTNPGEVPFRAGSVKVTDDNCDAPPALVGKADESGGDASPGTLDPGDTWTYECSHKTEAPGATCAVSTVKNTVEVTGGSGDSTVSDDDSHITTLNCPDVPPEPPLPEPTPTPTPIPPPNPSPSPVPPFIPAVPTPPPAGQVAVAGIRVRPGPARCITRASQVHLQGTHMTDVRVRVDGRLVRRKTLRVLQRSTTPLARLLGPGRHRLTVRVSFERGSATTPVTLTRTITVCASASRQPTFTG